MEAIVSELGHKLGCNIIRQELVDIIRENCKCYAGLLGTMRMGHKGYADKFEIPKLYPGRMAVAAKWGPPTPNENADKPWLAGCPRMIFISDNTSRSQQFSPWETIRQGLGSPFRVRDPVLTAVRQHRSRASAQVGFISPPRPGQHRRLRPFCIMFLRIAWFAFLQIQPVPLV